MVALSQKLSQSRDSFTESLFNFPKIKSRPINLVRDESGLCLRRNNRMNASCKCQPNFQYFKALLLTIVLLVDDIKILLLIGSDDIK